MDEEPTTSTELEPVPCSSDSERHPWPYLSKLFEFKGSKNDSWRFQCVKCLPQRKELLAFKNSPSNLKKHIERKHRPLLKEYLAATSSKKKGTLFADGGSSIKQRKLEDIKASQKTIDLAVVNFIVQGLHPFGVVEQTGFVDLIHCTQPDYTVMSRTTLRERIDKCTKQMKEKLKNAMQTVKYIATTTDCWTAHRQSFIGVTAHWIEPDTLERKSVALACKRLKGTHSYDVLASALNDIHSECNIREKIVWTTTDNASNFIKAFRVYACEDEGSSTEDESKGENDSEEEDAEEETEGVEVEALMEEEDECSEYQLPKHHRCACHILNLISTVDARKAESNVMYKKISRAAFSKCSALWNKSARSSTAAEVIERECKLQLIRPVETRWNSLFLAVERILRIIRESGEGVVRAVTIALKVPMFSPAELAFLSDYASTMNRVSKALNILQGEVDVHMGWLVPTITLLTVKLDRLQTSSKFCQPLISALQEGIQQWFGKMMNDPELISAAILLPKFRTSWTSNENLLKLGMDYIKTHMEEEPALSSPGSHSGSEEEDFFGLMKGNVHETTKQLDAYLANTSTSMDILKSVPTVFNLSLKLNTPLPASAACERMFSTAGHILSAKRGRLGSKSFENQILLKLNKNYW
ncbi:zinc finger BED domain-containing protein 4-like [Chanodichthys erythropterus]|uniref:zinc finger BED domain-containing protein 4-like n=1 Tax=Chanodichthys erythropterus TaxID=933992 RepID=UPI00351E98BC